MTVTIDIRREWDPKLEQTEDVTPAGSYPVLLSWQIDPWPVDATVPASIATALAGALTDAGAVWFRWDDTDPPSDPSGRFIRPPPRNPVRRLVDRLTVTWPAPIMATRSPRLAERLFEFDWDSQGQIALVLDPYASDTASVRNALQTRRQWTDFAVSPPVLALLAPTVDGGGAILCAASATHLMTLLDTVERHLRRVGLR